MSLDYEIVVPEPPASAASEFLRGLKDDALDSLVLTDFAHQDHGPVYFSNELARIGSILTGAPGEIQKCSRVQELKGWLIHMLALYAIHRQIPPPTQMDPYTTGQAVRHSLVRLVVVRAQNPMRFSGSIGVLVDSVQAQFVNTQALQVVIAGIMAENAQRTYSDGRFKIHT